MIASITVGVAIGVAALALGDRYSDEILDWMEGLSKSAKEYFDKRRK